MKFLLWLRLQRSARHCIDVCKHIYELIVMWGISLGSQCFESQANIIIMVAFNTSKLYPKYYHNRRLNTATVIFECGVNGFFSLLTLGNFGDEPAHYAKSHQSTIIVNFIKVAITCAHPGIDDDTRVQ